MGNTRTLAVSIALIVAAFSALLLTPHAPMPAVNGAGRRDLNTLIPHDFAEWTYLPNISLVVPDDRSHSNQIYTQVIGRGYSDQSGHVLMLLVAYGPTQDQLLQAHRPELCYTAAGFRILEKYDAALRYDADLPPITLTRLTTARESRFEPVSYWMRVGDQVAHGVVDRQIIRWKYGLRGVVPDGLLIRTSTVGLSPEQSFKVQERFLRDFLGRLTDSDRQFFTGKT